MKINNLIGLVLCVCILGGCMQSTALLGPAITVGTSGNIYQAGLSYGSSHILEKETGKNSIQYISSLMQKEIKPMIEPKGKINKDFIKLVEDQILNTRKKIFLKTN